MTAQPEPQLASPPAPDPTDEPVRRHAGHVHTRRCYWDFRECRWVCRPDPPAAEPS